MGTAEWDLDLSVPGLDLDRPPSIGPGGPGHAVGLVLALAIGLVGLGAGTLVSAAFTPPDPARYPPAVTLGVRDLYVDTSRPLPAAGPAERLGRPVARLRLEVDNPGPNPIRLSALVLDGVTSARIVLPLTAQIDSHRSGAVDVEVSADCSPQRLPTVLRAQLRLAGSTETQIPVTPSRELEQRGGLCSVFDIQLPRGWRTPLQATRARLLGHDLEVTVTGLPGDQVAAVLLEDQVLSRVFVSDRPLTMSTELPTDRPAVFRLRGPPPCIQTSGTAPIPFTVKVLTRSKAGLEQRLVLIGPELTRWTAQACGG